MGARYGHLVTDDQKAERAHHLDRIGREVLRAVFSARFWDRTSDEGRKPALPSATLIGRAVLGGRVP
jgi:hypothetical protein